MGTPPFALDQVVLAVRLVRDRLLRATSALEEGGVAYAVTAECAAAAWIGTIEPTLLPAPSVEEFARPHPAFRSLALEPLVRWALTRFRLNDRVDLRDMLDVDLVGDTWVRRFSPELGARLQHLIDTPDG